MEDDNDINLNFLMENNPVVIDADTGVPSELLDACEHFDDVTDSELTERQKSKVRYDMRKLVENQGLHRTVASQLRKDY